MFERASFPIEKTLSMLPRLPNSSLDEDQLQRISSALSFAFEGILSPEEIQQKAQNLEIIKFLQHPHIVDGFYKDIKVSFKAMKFCVLPLVQNNRNITTCDFTFCIINQEAMKLFMGNRHTHNIQRIFMSRLVPISEKKIDDIPDAINLNGEKVSKKCDHPFIQYRVNPHYIPPDFASYLSDYVKDPYQSLTGTPDLFHLTITRQTISTSWKKTNYGHPYPVHGRYGLAETSAIGTTENYEFYKVSQSQPTHPLPIGFLKEKGMGLVNITKDGIEIDPTNTECTKEDILDLKNKFLPTYTLGESKKTSGSGTKDLGGHGMARGYRG